MARRAAVAASILLLVICGREMIVRGAPAYARTIVSRTGLSPKASENALLLLDQARQELPDGATVVFLDDRKPGSAGVNFAVAAGQLPKQRVLPAERAGEAAYILLRHGGDGGEIVRRR